MINAILENIFNTLPNTISILIVLGFSILALLIALLISFTLIRLILKINWENQTVKRFIRIKNEGNVNEKFLIKLEIPKTELNYQCLLEGMQLPVSTVVQKVIVSQPVHPMTSTEDVESTQNPNQLSESEKQPQDKDAAKKKLEESANKAKDTSKKGLGIIRLFSGILGSVGALIPGSVGRSFKEKSGALQKTSQDASTKMQMPGQKLKSVDQLKGQVNQISPNAKDKKSVAAKAGSTANKQVLNDDLITSPKITPSTESGVQYREVPLSDYFETPPLSPGNIYNLEVVMDPIHPYRSMNFNFGVFIRQIQTFKEIITDEKSEVKKNIEFSIKGLSPIYWILSFLMVLSTVLLNSTWAVLFISWLARFVI